MKSLNFPGRKMRHQIAAIALNETSIAGMEQEFERTKDPALSAKLARCRITLVFQKKAMRFPSIDAAQGHRSKKSAKDRGRTKV